MIAKERSGWISSVILLTTLGRQVYTQWKTRATQGVSRRLRGQLATALVGEALLLRNRRLQSGRP